MRRLSHSVSTTLGVLNSRCNTALLSVISDALTRRSPSYVLHRLALALHSAGHKDEALRVAIEAQIETLPQYQRSIRNYAAALTASTGPDDLSTR